MTGVSTSSTILSVLEEQEPGVALSVGEIVDSVQEQLEERNRVPEDNEIRGRLSRLHKEGVLERPERGQYALIRAEPEQTNQLAQLVNVVSKRVRPSALRRTVLWDATPYLSRAEDGGPGTRLVVEHRNVASLQDEIEVFWPEQNAVATWSTKTAGPLGPLLWRPDTPTPYRMPAGIVFVEREKFGATGITPDGYRTPFPERVLAEFLGEDGLPETAPVVRNLLQDPEVSFDRLWAAAETLGVTVEVGALLAGLKDEIRPELRADFLETLAPVTGTLIEGER